jgi:hypothetical protein
MGLPRRLQAGPVECIGLQNGYIIVTYRIRADSCQTCPGNAIDEDIPFIRFSQVIQANTEPYDVVDGMLATAR